jgi:integrase
VDAFRKRLALLGGHRSTASYRKEGRVWYYRYVNAEGRPVERAGCPDKGVTMRLAADAEAKVALERAGLADPFETHRRRPIEDHIGEYVGFLTSKSNTEKHVTLTSTRLRAVIAGCGVARLGDLDAAKVSTWLSDRRAETMSAATSNYYMQSITGFARWLVKHGRMSANPLAPLSPMNTKTDRRHDRGTLTTDEFDALIRATMPAKPFRGMSGRDRTTLYLVASYTGLRAAELASLTSSSFRLDSPNPTVHVLATNTKNGTSATLPIHAELADRLRAYLSGKEADSPVWPGTWLERSAKMLRDDLARAGVAYQDDEGLYRDFHSLRHRFGSELAKANVPPKVAQTLMRHSTITLTLDRYSHVGLTDTAGAIGKLPTLPQELPMSPSVPHYFPIGGDGSGRGLTDAGGTEGEVTLTPTVRNLKGDEGLDGASRGLTVSDVNSGGGIRTPDTRIMIPLL